jgi:hypothetical protein
MADYGLAAIARHNGWEMALLGILIVFTGLSLLAFSISRLHRILAFFEKRKPSPLKEKTFLSGRRAQKAKALPEPFAGTPDFRPAYLQYGLLRENLPLPLSLPRLLDLAEKRGVFRSHAVLADLLRAGVLETDGEGFYTWNDEAFRRITDGASSLKKPTSTA